MMMTTTTRRASSPTTVATLLLFATMVVVPFTSAATTESKEMVAARCARYMLPHDAVDCFKVDVLSKENSTTLFKGGGLFKPGTPVQQSVTGRAKPHCSLSIVLAGSPRSGSTLTQKMVHDAIRALNLDVTNVGYWRRDRHSNWTHSWEDGLRALQSMKNSSIVVTKSHQYDSELLGLCDESMVLTQARHPDEIAKSVLAAGWTNNCDSLLTILASMEKRHRCLDRHSSISMYYRHVVSDRTLTY